MSHRKPRQSNGSWGKNADKHQGKQHNSARTKPGWIDGGKHTNSDRNRSGGGSSRDIFSKIGDWLGGKKR